MVASLIECGLAKLFKREAAMKNNENVPEPGDLSDPLPGFDPRISSLVAEAELAGGVNLEELRVGSRLEVTTINSIYVIEKRGPKDYFISGNLEFCPEPTKCFIHGSTWGGNMIKVGFVGRGMFLEFGTRTYTKILTSLIREVREI